MERSWILGESSLLWEQDTTKPEVEECKIVPLPLEWTNLFMDKNVTPGEELSLITEKIKNQSQEELAIVQPLLHWLLVAGCKAKSTQRSRTETPNSLVWAPTFPNSEEVKWASKNAFFWSANGNSINT